MSLRIEAIRGVWRAQNESRTYFDETLEGLLVQLAPDAPAEYVYHTAEVLGGVLGAEVVEVPQMSPEYLQAIEQDFAALADAVFNAQDDPDHWEPTDAQRAYFHPDEYPRGA